MKSKKVIERIEFLTFIRREGYEFDAGAGVIGKQSTNLWYAFVDLQEDEGGFHPQVFIVPSKWVAEFVKSDFSRKLFFLTKEAASLCLERWDYIKRTLIKEQSLMEFASLWPDEMVHWGC